MYKKCQGSESGRRIDDCTQRYVAKVGLLRALMVENKELKDSHVGRKIQDSKKVASYAEVVRSNP